MIKVPTNFKFQLKSVGSRGHQRMPSWSNQLEDMVRERTKQLIQEEVPVAQSNKVSPLSSSRNIQNVSKNRSSDPTDDEEDEDFDMSEFDEQQNIDSTKNSDRANIDKLSEYSEKIKKQPGPFNCAIIPTTATRNSKIYSMNNYKRPKSVGKSISYASPNGILNKFDKKRSDEHHRYASFNQNVNQTTVFEGIAQNIFRTFTGQVAQNKRRLQGRSTGI